MFPPDKNFISKERTLYGVKITFDAKKNARERRKQNHYTKQDKRHKV